VTQVDAVHSVDVHLCLGNSNLLQVACLTFAPEDLFIIIPESKQTCLLLLRDKVFLPLKAAHNLEKVEWQREPVILLIRPAQTPKPPKLIS
jgi:hypothetical protein